MNSTDFDKDMQKFFKKIMDFGVEKCCVCHHDLNVHFDEGDFWRCHSLGVDFYQCECILNKHKAKDDISFYDLAKRAKEQIEDLSQEKLISEPT